MVNSAVRNMIRESKIHQIDNVIYSVRNEGMIAMMPIFPLYQQGASPGRPHIQHQLRIDEQKL